MRTNCTNEPCRNSTCTTVTKALAPPQSRTCIASPSPSNLSDPCCSPSAASSRCSSGPAIALSWCAGACLNIQAAHSAPSRNNRGLAEGPYMHADSTSGAAGKDCAAVTDLQVSLVQRCVQQGGVWHSRR
jgi:hypothetical protein